MKIYSEIMYILLYSFLGELISKIFKISIPGSVIGMILLFLSLQFKIINLERIENSGNFLVNNLAILFIAAGVGIMTKFNYIKEIWFSFFIICILTTTISLAVIAIVVNFVKKRYEDKNERDS